jgi:hypothetical protein
MRKLFVILVLGVLSSLPLMAQDKLEVFGGYQYLHLGTLTANGQSIPFSSQTFNGWNAGAAAKLSRFFGVGADFGGGFAIMNAVPFHSYTYTGGPVVFVNAGVVQSFAHALVGGVRLSGSDSGVALSWNGLTAMAGGGVDARLSKFFAVRLAEVDWLYFHLGSQTVGGTPFPSFNGRKNVRVTTGVVFRF